MRAEGLDAGFVEDAAAVVPSGELRVEGGRSVLLAEGHWADIVRDRRGGWVRGGLARLRLVVAAVPCLLIAVLSPRGGEAVAAANVGAGFDEARRVAPVAWRMLTFAGVITAAIWLFTWSWVVGIAVTVVVLVLVVVAIVMPGSVVEHVRFASAGGDELAEILARVSAAVSFTEENCERVWVIAHSQGGYLAHRVLWEGAHPRVRRFTGVASGLRPITIARAVRSGRMLAAGWIHLFGTGLLSFGLLLALQPGACSLSSRWCPHSLPGLSGSRSLPCLFRTRKRSSRS